MFKIEYISKTNYEKTTIKGLLLDNFAFQISFILNYNFFHFINELMHP